MEREPVRKWNFAASHIFPLLLIIMLMLNMSVFGENVVWADENNINKQSEQDSIDTQAMQDHITMQTTVQNNAYTQEREEVHLFLDNVNCYDGMDKPYCDGYVPYVAHGTAVVVLPVISSGALKNNTLTSLVGLGDAANAPFVYKNYEKTTTLQTYAFGENLVECYLIRYDLALKANRMNGTYPVGITISGQDMNGIVVQKEVTVYVTITDGKNPEDENLQEKNTDDAVFQPIILIKSSEFKKNDKQEDDITESNDADNAQRNNEHTENVQIDRGNADNKDNAQKNIDNTDHIQAGEEFTITTTLINTSSNEAVKNMVITLVASNEALELTNESDKLFAGDILAGGTREITYHVKTKKEAAGGFYKIELQMSYADSHGNSYTDHENVKFNVLQPAKIQFDPLIITPEAQVGDIITARVHAMNLGRSKVYNVRAEISADGLVAEGTLYIGDIEQGQEGNAGVNVSVWGLTKGEDRYGASEGKIVYYYEDESGNESSIEKTFNINIQSPFTDIIKREENEDNPRQWWIIIAVLLSGIVIAGGSIMLKAKKQKMDS